MTLTVFAGVTGQNDGELWSTDGTTGRTSLLKNVNPGASAFVGNSKAGGGGVLPFAVVGNFAYFAADDGTNGTELWRTDGTLAGTTKMTEFFTTAGTTGFNPTNIIAAGTNIYFVGEGPAAANPGTSPARNGIWKFDTTNPANPPVFVTDNNGINAMFAVGTRIYWTFSSATEGVGTYDGTTLNATLTTGTPGALYDAGGTVYFGRATGSISKIVGTTVTAVTGFSGGAPSGFIHTTTHVYIFNNQTNTLWTTTPLTNTATQITAAGLTFDFQNNGPSHIPGAAALGNKLIFSNNKTNAGVGANTGSELWISDGTNAGTVLLKDIVPGLTGSAPHNFVTVGGFVFFQATNGAGSVELWKTDGTLGGTVLVDTLFAGGLSGGSTSELLTPGNIDNMSVQNGLLYFSFDDQVHGMELWRSDGTAAGTLMVKELNTGTQDTNYQNVPTPSANLGSLGLFVGWSQTTGYELFVTNGAAGTLLKDIDPGGGNSKPREFVVIGPKAYFTAFSPGTGSELWVSDGTSAGTVLVKDINPGVNGGGPGGMVAIGTKLYFSASDGVNGTELWISDGTTAGTFMLKDIDAGFVSGSPRDSFPGGFVEAGGKVFFTASTSTTGRELWVTDGTTAGTQITKNIGSGAGDANIFSNLLSYGGKVYFSASDGLATGKGQELWVSDGTDAGTVVLKDLNTNPNGSGGTDSSNPTDFVLANGLFFFRAGGLNPGSGNEVYVSNGTAGNATPVSATLTSFSNLVAAGNQVFFTAQGANGQELYVTNGGAAVLRDIVAGAGSSNASNPVAFGTKVLFSAQGSAAAGTELWISDGGAVGAGPTGTFQLKDINPTANESSNPQQFVVVGTKAYFVADDGVHGQELWVTDGTTAGTVLVKDINTIASGVPGETLGASVQVVRALDNAHLLFLADDGLHGGAELWITDGTAGGTFRATDVVQPNSGLFGTNSSGSLNGGGAPIGTFATVPFTLPAGATGETFNGTADADYFDGLGGNDVINGLGGDDVLFGGAASDSLDGGTGADIMAGGAGNDFLVVDSAADQVIEAIGGGSDIVFTTVNYTLPAGQEIESLGALIAGSTTALVLTGNEFANRIVGNAGSNSLDGAGGADQLFGEGGNDFYVVDSVGDIVVENLGAGFDIVFAKVSYILTAGQEVESLGTLNEAGTTAIDLTGNEFANLIVGNAGVNSLNGGAGADQLYGNGGNDFYVVDNINDQVFETVGNGYDIVFATTSYALIAGQDVESLGTLNASATTAINLIGNEIANRIVGNAGVNFINGALGADELYGGAGADEFGFTSALGGGNVDFIGDFAPEDQIDLENAVFTALAAGALNPNAFVLGASAQDADDRIIYYSPTGLLIYDADGSGPGGAVLFATVTPNTTITAGDFLVI